MLRLTYICIAFDTDLDMPNSDQITPQALGEPSQTKASLSTGTPPDSTSLLYFMRQEKASEFQWLEVLMKNKTLHLNQSKAPSYNLIALRRNLLIEERTGKKVELVVEEKDTTTVTDADTTAVAVTDTDSTTEVSTQDTIQQAVEDSVETQVVSPQVDTLKSEPTEEVKLVEEVATKIDTLKENVNSIIPSSDLMLIVLIFSFFVSTWVRVRFPLFMRQMFLSLLAYSESYKVYRESNRMAHQFYFALGFVFSINVALFLLQNIEFYKLPTFGMDGLALFGILFLLVLTVYFVKKLALRTIGQLFMAFRVAEEYWFSVSTINRALGIILFPFLIAIPYVPDNIRPYVMQATWGVVGLSFIFRILRGMRIAFEKHLSVFFMFLYFCTLEILPLVIVIKFLMDQVSGF